MRYMSRRETMGKEFTPPEAQDSRKEWTLVATFPIGPTEFGTLWLLVERPPGPPGIQGGIAQGIA